MVDDIDSDLITLENHIIHAINGKHEIEFVKYNSGDLILADKITDFDAVFLDICMKGLDGIDTAVQIREKFPSKPIIFVTSSEEYVWKSFSVHPFDYLLKPYDYNRVSKLLSDFMKILEKNEPELEISVSRQKINIPFKKIYYITSQNHSVNITTDNGTYNSAITFSSIQKCICKDQRFLVCNRGIAVNMDYVLKFENDCIYILDGKVFPVRQKDKSKFFAEFTQYQFRKMRDNI